MRREGKILVVEDNPLIAHAVEEAGARLAMTTDCATDGWEAIEKLENEEYAAIVIDADLPRHSGYGVLTYLREEIGEDLGNVILMSADCEGLQRRMTGDHVRMIRKTEQVDDLAKAIENDE